MNTRIRHLVCRIIPLLLAGVALLAIFTAPAVATEYKDGDFFSVTVINEQKDPVYVRASVKRYPVYCQRFIGGDGATAVLNCYESKNREALEAIPAGHRLVLTDVFASASFAQQGELIRGAIGALQGENGITAPGMSINADARVGGQWHFNTPLIILNPEDQLAMRNNSSGLNVNIVATGFLIKASELNRAF